MPTTDEIMKTIEEKIARCEKCNNEYIISNKGCPVCNDNNQSTRTVYNNGGRKVG